MVKQRWGVIYKLTNKNNGKYYFGKTVNYKKRMIQHKNSWKKGTTYLCRAIKKNGFENFNKEIIVKNIICRYITTKPNGRKVYDESELNRLEKHHISLFQSDNRKYGYNLTKGGEGVSGLIHSDETKKKMAMSTKKHDAEKGTISYNIDKKKWQVRSASPQYKFIGYYNTPEKALKALNIFNETGKRTERRKGSIQLTKSNKYQLRYKGKYIGRFNTKELTEAALKKIINN